MSKSISKSHKITWSEHVDIRSLAYLIDTGTPFLTTKQALCSTWPAQHYFVSAEASHMLEPSIVSAILLHLTKTWNRSLSAIPLHYIEAVLRSYPHEIQAEILKILTAERQQMKADIESKIPPDILARLNDSLSSIEQALINNDPMISNHLRASHSLLISYPETVHLLDDTEVARLIKAAEVHTKVTIAKVTAPKTAKASAKKAALDDF